MSRTRSKSNEEVEDTIQAWFRVVPKEGLKKKTGKTDTKKKVKGGQKSFFFFFFYHLGSQKGIAYVVIAMTGGPARRVVIIRTIVQHIYIISSPGKMQTPKADYSLSWYA